MITKRQWEDMTKEDAYHLLRLENETYIKYQMLRVYFFIKHLFIKENKSNTDES